jgi:hypothetical protein
MARARPRCPLFFFEPSTRPALLTQQNDEHDGDDHHHADHHAFTPLNNKAGRARMTPERNARTQK